MTKNKKEIENFSKLVKYILQMSDFERFILLEFSKDIVRTSPFFCDEIQRYIFEKPKLRDTFLV